MSSKALFVAIETEAGKEGEVATFLRRARAAVADEPRTLTWYALRFDPRTFAIFDTCPGNAARLKHLLGEVGRSLSVKTFTEIDSPPDIGTAEIIAAKAPAAAEPHVALHVPLTARWGREEQVAALLRDTQPAVDAEPGTLAWYALRLGPASFAIVEVFADEAARAAHLAGPAAAALAENGTRLFTTAPRIRKADVLATKRAA